MPAPPALDLSRQIALVTGSSSGIGRACAIALGRAGATVVVNYSGLGKTSGSDAEAVVAEIAKAGGQAVAMRADVSQEEDVEAMFAETVRRFGTLHILVANAGIQRDAPVAQMTLAQWRQVLDVNLTGQFLCARAAVREFLRRGPQPEISAALGKIICMSSVHEVIPWGGHVNYAASKGGVMLFMKSLAQEVAQHRIRVNSIGPGAIQTAINRAAWDTKQALSSLLTLIPYGRIGQPDDIARAAVWLASDQSDYVTGTTLFVDGGMTLYPGFSEGG
ncbi:MAG TPA: SDR family oxidoreductase [Alphaproteobacteria bacterium]|nr:SDR family oxidoreductase [Alphaproteobacteria bacterium]